MIILRKLCLIISSQVCQDLKSWIFLDVIFQNTQSLNRGLGQFQIFYNSDHIGIDDVVQAVKNESKRASPAVTVLCKSNAKIFHRNSWLSLIFWRRNIELFMKANIQWKVMIIHDAYCVQLCKFTNDNPLRTKIDFKFSSKNLLFDKWLQTLEQNFVLCLLCLNIPRLSEKYLVLFIYKLLDEGQTWLLSNLPRPQCCLNPCSSFAPLAIVSWNSQGHCVASLPNKTNNLPCIRTDLSLVACIKAMIQIFSHASNGL